MECFLFSGFPSVLTYTWVLNLLIIVTVVNVMVWKMAAKANAVLMFVALPPFDIREITYGE
jgi:hypothetical protein